MTKFTAAVIQAGSVPFDSKSSTEKACKLIAEAAQRGAKLLVFPEAFISAYPKGLDFGARVGLRFPEGRSDFLRYWESAIEVPGPETEMIGTSAKENGVYVAIGVIERDIGTLYCTVLCFLA